MEDIEKRLKDLLKAAKSHHGVNSITLYEADVEEILGRFKDYRDRFGRNAHKSDLRVAKLQSDYQHLRCLMDSARRRLDPEGKGTGHSQVSTADVALHIEAIEKARGKVVAQRLLYGSAMPGDIAEETEGVLQAAIDSAKAEEAKWRKYQKDEWEKKKKAREESKGKKEQELGLLGKLVRLFKGNSGA